MTGLIRFNGMPTVRWNPQGMRAHAAHGGAEIDRALQLLASEVFGATHQSTASNATFPADVRETATAYIVQFDVPGVSKEGITVDVDERTVRVEALFKREPVDGETALLTERANTALTRTVSSERCHDHAVGKGERPGLERLKKWI